MKNKIKLLTLIGLAAFGSAGLMSCSSSTKGEASVMQIDLNPSVEFVVDGNNKVISVTALNDDGSVILSGEAFIGLSAEETVDKYIKIAVETGYLSAGLDATKNDLNISISGNSEYIENLKTKVKTKAEEAIEASGIKAKVEDIKTLATETVKTKLEEAGIDLSAYQGLSGDELQAKLAEDLGNTRAKVETFVTEELRDLYDTYVKDELLRAKSEVEEKALQTAIDGLDIIKKGLLSAVKLAYDGAVTAYTTAVTAIDTVQYSLVDENGTYQKQINTIHEKKLDVIEKRDDLAGLDPEGAEYLTKSGLLTTAEGVLTQAETALETIRSGIVSQLDQQKSSLENTVKPALDDAYNNLVSAIEGFDANKVSEDLTAKYAEVESTVKTKFENTYASDIKAIKDELAAQKTKLINAINGAGK